MGVRSAAWAFVGAILAGPLAAQTLVFVSEYGSGNLRAFDPTTAAAVTLPAGYQPVGGVATGSDGMVLDASGRLYVNRGNGTITRRGADGLTFSPFATIGGGPELLDLTRNETHLFAARFGRGIWRVDLATAAVTALTLPAALETTDGVRIGPDGRLYAVDSTDGQIFALDLATSTWSTFLGTTPAGQASQLEFGADGRVFLSRTIGTEARIYRYALNAPGDLSVGLNPASATLVGAMGTGTATGIRLGPDGRLYANLFTAGEVWRSNLDATAMERFVTGLDQPGSILFATVPEPGVIPLLLSAILAGAVPFCRFPGSQVGAGARIGGRWIR